MALSTNQIMGFTTCALLPGALALALVWGLGIVSNLLILLLFAFIFDLVILRIKRRKFSDIQDTFLSSALTVSLIGICLPPSVNLGVLLVACLSSLGIAREAYGGLGRNVFNPAMVGYAIILIAYPEHLAIWPEAHIQSDGLSGATLLTEFKYRNNLTMQEFNMLHLTARESTTLISSAFLLGGLFLLSKRIITWHIPITLFATIGLLAMWGYDNGSSQTNGSPWFHLTSGGLVAASFFVATDPVTHPLNKNHQLFFAFLIGAIVYVIRTMGSLPDGIAFAILFANCVTPILNRYHLTKNSYQ